MQWLTERCVLRMFMFDLYLSRPLCKFRVMPLDSILNKCSLWTRWLNTWTTWERGLDPHMGENLHLDDCDSSC